MLQHLRQASVLLVVLTVLTGLAYPYLVTGIAQLVFPGSASGSLVEREGKAAGSELIGQPFDDPKWFWSRPSGTGPFPYNAGLSVGSNLGPTNKTLADAVKANVERLRASDPGNTRPIPVDLVTASASGLDPHLSPAAALWQVPRVARIRGLAEDQVRRLVEDRIEGRFLGVFGERRVNVLQLNLALEGLMPR